MLLVSFFCAAAAAAPPASKEFRFTLQVPEVIIANFDSVTGLIVETEVTEFRDGTSGEVRKLPGAKKYGDITLKRGLTRDKSLWSWRDTVDAGGPFRVNGSITMFDRTGSPVATWHFQNAWPTKVEAALDPESGDAVEAITIVVERIERP